MPMASYRGFKISDMAYFCGLTPQGLRYFEERGLIEPHREEGSGYRRYDLFEVGLIQRLKMLRDFGFPIEECRKIIQSNDIDHVMPSIIERERELAEEIAHKRRMLALLSRKAALLSMLDLKRGIVERGSLPAYYQLTYARLDVCLDKHDALEVLQRWHDMSPLVHSMPYFAYENGTWSQLNSSLSVFERDIDDCGLSREDFCGPYVEYHPVCPALNAFVGVSHDLGEREFAHPSNPPFHLFEEYMTQNDLVPTGDLILNPLVTFAEGGEETSYYHAWMPYGAASASQVR